MSTISLRVSDEELLILKSYATINNCSLSEIIRVTMLERIEEEYDLRVLSKYENETGQLKTKPITELWKELNL